MVVGAQGHVVSTQPGSRRGFVTGDVTKHHVFFFFFPLLFQKQTSNNKKKKEFLNLWSTQKGEAPAEGELRTVPVRRGTRCLSRSLSRVPAPRGDTTVPGDMGPGLLLLLLTAADVWHGRSTSCPKPSGAALGCGEGFLWVLGASLGGVGRWPRRGWGGGDAGFG